MAKDILIKRVTGYNGPPVARDLYRNGGDGFNFNVLLYGSVMQPLT